MQNDELYQFCEHFVYYIFDIETFGKDFIIANYNIFHEKRS
jgi:hypothetical protein